MKILKLLSLIGIILFTSCSSVRVFSDYDTKADFNKFNTYAFFKPGIDDAEVSDLDKRRILRAIDANLQAKGMNKSQSPTLLVSIFTKEQDRVDVYNNNFGWGWGWGWGPFWGGNLGTSVARTTEGSLYIDLIDAKTNELVWQGVGQSALYTGSDVDKREERIIKIVTEILEEYPPKLRN